MHPNTNPSMSSFTINLATPDPSNRRHHLAGIIDHPLINWMGLIEPPFKELDEGIINAVICTCEWYTEYRLCNAACRLRGIPTFHVMDGVIRWKNLFENPRSLGPDNGSPFLRPLISDKTFVMGELQASVLRWLGNSDVCVSGLPRFANYERKDCRYGLRESPRLLIASSNNPWYTEEQRPIFMRTFTHLIETLNSLAPSLECELQWRLSPSMRAPEIDPSWLGPHPPLLEQLKACSAFITTPSTVAVEAMLLGIPTMIFDPWADPILIPSPWLASEPKTAAALLPSLLNPSRERARMQDCMRDYAICDSRNAPETIVQIMADHLHTKCTSERISPGSIASLASEVDYNNPQLVGLIQTIPKLAKAFEDQQKTLSTLESLVELLQNHMTASRPLPKRLKSFIRRQIAIIRGSGSIHN